MVDVIVNRNEALVTVVNTDRVTVVNAADLKSVIVDELNRDRDVIVDLVNVKYMDSTGISVLISGTKASRLSGNNFKLRNVQADVMKLFVLMKLNQVFDIEK